MNGELVQQRTGRLAVVRGRPLSEQLAVAAVRELGAQREALDLAPRRTVRRVTLTLDIRPDGTVGGVTTAIDSSDPAGLRDRIGGFTWAERQALRRAGGAPR